MSKLNINAKNLLKEIDTSFKEVRRNPFLETEEFAIFETNGVQIKVVITKDEHEQLEDITPNLAFLS